MEGTKWRLRESYNFQTREDLRQCEEEKDVAISWSEGRVFWELRWAARGIFEYNESREAPMLQQAERGH